LSTIKKVAQEAKVSVATVSRVLNSTGYVNEETRKKVLKVIEELDYKPNSVARSLFKKQSMTIALIVPNITNPFFPEVARAIEDVLSSKNYTLILCNSDDNAEKEKKYFEVMKQKYVDGVIVVTSTLTPQYIEEKGIPIVAVDRFIDANIPCISVNNIEGAKRAVQHLRATGCKKIAHIRGPKNITSAEDRYNGYLSEVKKEAWFRPEYVKCGNFNIEQTTAATKNLLENNPDIDGIFAGNDLMAVGVIKAAIQLGKRIPEDISIIGFDGINLCKMTNPEITTIAQPIYEIGSVAAQTLLDLIEGKIVENKHHQLQVSISEGESTKKMR
jgi:LacI family transcriptional regulator